MSGLAIRGRSCQKPNSGVVLLLYVSKVKMQQSWRMWTRVLGSIEENSVEMSRSE